MSAVDYRTKRTAPLAVERDVEALDRRAPLETQRGAAIDMASMTMRERHFSGGHRKTDHRETRPWPWPSALEVSHVARHRDMPRW